MSGSTFYLVRKGDTVSLLKGGDNVQRILTVQVPPALGSNSSKTMTWHMTVTWEKIILSSHGHVVVCKALSYLTDGVKVPLETPPSGSVSYTTLFSLLAFLAVCMALGFVIYLGFIDYQHGIHTTRAYPRCMGTGQTAVPGDVFCKGADNIVDGNHHLECTAFPHWLVRDQAWFDRRDHSLSEMNNLKLTLQMDGNLVLYDGHTGKQALWESGTSRRQCSRVCYEGDDTFKLWCGLKNSHENVIISKKKREEQMKKKGPQGVEGPPGFLCPLGPKGFIPLKRKKEEEFVCDHSNRLDKRCFGIPKDWDFGLDGHDFIDHPIIPHASTLEEKGSERYTQCPTFFNDMQSGAKLRPECGQICDHTGCIVLTLHGQLRDLRSLREALPFQETDRRYRLEFQPDGNLVLYNYREKAVWSSETENQGCSHVKKHGDVLSIVCKHHIKNIQLSKQVKK